MKEYFITQMKVIHKKFSNDVSDYIGNEQKFGFKGGLLVQRVK